MGIRRLSEVCFGFGSFIMLLVLFMDKTFYILNLFVQSMGFYLQGLIETGTHTDTFEQLGPSAHAEMDRFIPEGFGNPDGPKRWIDDWTMFYWGWWISWSPFVGKKEIRLRIEKPVILYINSSFIVDHQECSLPRFPKAGQSNSLSMVH